MSCAPGEDALTAVVVSSGLGVPPDISCRVQGHIGQEGSCGAEIQPLGSLVPRSAQITAVMFAQCRTVKISILGDEGVPVQVDGEAWIQPPGYIRIIHKNRAQTLTRDRVRKAACGDPERTHHSQGSPVGTPVRLLEEGPEFLVFCSRNLLLLDSEFK